MNAKDKQTIDSKKYASGTTAYLSPELLQKKPHGPPADYYAIGIMLYEFLKGRKKRPYEGRTRKDIKEAHQKGEV